MVLFLGPLGVAVPDSFDGPKVRGFQVLLCFETLDFMIMFITSVELYLGQTRLAVGIRSMCG